MIIAPCPSPFLHPDCPENQYSLVITSTDSFMNAQSCPTLCKPRDGNPPDSSVYGISQARILEWVAIPFSRGSSPSRDSTWGLLHCRMILYHLSHTGKPQQLPTQTHLWMRASLLDSDAVSNNLRNHFTHLFYCCCYCYFKLQNMARSHTYWSYFEGYMT